MGIERLVIIDYTNWEGVRGFRKIEPNHMYFGSNKWHPTPQWLVRAFDFDKREERIFALKNIHSWVEVEKES